MRVHAVLVLAAFLAASPLAPAQDRGADGKTPDRENTLAVARRIMNAARFCTLVTIGDHGQPQARVVDPLEPDPGFVVYIATNPKSRKVPEMAKDPRVTLLYFDASRLAYVTVIGRAAEVSAAEKPSHRKKDWDAFFPASKPEAYALYRVTPARLEVVSEKDGLSGDPVTWRPEIVNLK